MAFSEEQEQSILTAIGQMNDFLKAQNGKQELENKPDDKTDNLKNEAEKKAKEQNEAGEQQAQIEKAVGFNMNITKFAEDYKSVLPQSVKSIIETANKKTYASQTIKADEVRKAIIDAYVEIEKNVEALPDSVRAKVAHYKELAEDAKKAKSANFWEIVEIGTAMAKEKNRANAVNMANGNNGGAENAFRVRFFSQGDKWKNKE